MLQSGLAGEGERVSLRLGPCETVRLGQSECTPHAPATSQMTSKPEQTSNFASKAREDILNAGSNEDVGHTTTMRVEVEL